MASALPRGFTVYTTSLGAVRGERENSRRVKQLFDTLSIKYFEVDLANSRLIDVSTLRSRCRRAATLPLAFVGDNFVGDFDDISQWNEEGKLLAALQERGYTPQEQLTPQEAAAYMVSLDDGVAMNTPRAVGTGGSLARAPLFGEEAQRKAFHELPEQVQHLAATICAEIGAAELDLLQFMSAKHVARVYEWLEAEKPHPQIWKELEALLKTAKRDRFLSEMGLQKDDMRDPLEVQRVLHQASEDRDKQRAEHIRVVQERVAAEHKDMVERERQRQQEEQMIRRQEIESLRREREAQDLHARIAIQRTRIVQPPTDRERLRQLLHQQALGMAEIQELDSKRKGDYMFDPAAMWPNVSPIPPLKPRDHSSASVQSARGVGSLYGSEGGTPPQRRVGSAPRERVGSASSLTPRLPPIN